jgi:small subunit ribosomal protein S17
METRDNKRKVLTATVLSDKMMKTRVVQVVTMRRHPMYLKQMKFHTKYKAHDEKNEAHVGDIVEIMETRRLSKDKRWTIIKIVKKSEGKEAVVV